MSKLLLCTLALMLILGLAAGVQAASESTVVEWTWDAVDWQIDPATEIPYLTLSGLPWQGDTDGACILRLTGPGPCVDDPDVHQTILNTTPVSWTDFHVSIVNGYIEAAGVGKVGGYSWMVDIAPDGSGFDAYTAMPSARVAPGEQLSVWFRYTATGGNVIIDEYPTTGYIPEPSSLIALASAVAAFGVAGIRRRLS